MNLDQYLVCYWFNSPGSRQICISGTGTGPAAKKTTSVALGGAWLANRAEPNVVTVIPLIPSTPTPGVYKAWL